MKLLERRVARRRVGWSDLPLLVRPQVLAGNSREATVAVCCLTLLGTIFVLELATPDVVLSSIALVPVMAAMWALSSGWAIRVAVTAVALLGLAIIIEEGNRASLIVFALTILVIALVTRLYAERLTTILSRHPNREPSPPMTGAPARLEPFERSADGIATLTRRELEVASLACHGLTASQIGTRLHISERTVESHLARTYERLGIHSRFELMRLATDLNAFVVRNAR